MNTKIIKIAILGLLSLLAIGAVFVIRNSIHKGYTVYLKGVDAGSFTIDPMGRRWVLERKERSQEYPGGADIIHIQENGAWTTYLPKDYLPEGSTIPEDFFYILPPVFDQQGNAWLGTSAFGLIKFDGENWMALTTGNSGLASNENTTIFADQRGRVWITYFAENSPGVTVFDGSDWTTYNTDNSGLPSNGAYNIQFDAENQVWITYSPWVDPSPGVTVFDGKTWTTYPKDVYSLAFDAENRTWIGTKQGLSIYDGKEWASLTSTNSEQITEAVRGIQFDQMGRAWLICQNDQSRIIVIDGDHWTQYSLEEMGFKNNFTLYLLIDQSGRTWVWNYDEARILEDGKWIRLDQPKITPIRDISMDEPGKIWIVKRDKKGLLAFDADYPFATTKQSFTMLWIFQIIAVTFVLLTLASLLGEGASLIILKYLALILAFIIPTVLFAFGGFYIGISLGMTQTDYPLGETLLGILIGGNIGVAIGIFFVIFLRRKLFRR